MTPRDIDAALAVNLFVLKNVTLRKDPMGVVFSGGPDPDWYSGPVRRDDLSRLLGPPGLLVHRYSSTWEGLGLVVEAMRMKGWGVWMATKESGVGWDVGFEKGEQRAAVIEDCALPMAVSLAALKALGVEVPK